MKVTSKLDIVIQETNIKGVFPYSSWSYSYMVHSMTELELNSVIVFGMFVTSHADDKT